MRSMLTKSAILAAGFLIAAAGSARADTVEVKVPFAFEVGGQTMPAGQYRIERGSASPYVLLIRGEQGDRAVMFVQTNQVEGHNPAGNVPALTFDEYETGYRLAAVWESGSVGREIAGVHRGSPRIAQAIVFADPVS
jgi:hypothetical protein